MRSIGGWNHWKGMVAAQICCLLCETMPVLFEVKIIRISIWSWREWNKIKRERRGKKEKTKQLIQADSVYKSSVNLWQEGKPWRFRSREWRLQKIVQEEVGRPCWICWRVNKNKSSSEEYYFLLSCPSALWIFPWVLRIHKKQGVKL